MPFLREKTRLHNQSTLYYWITETEIVVGEHSDNPHDLNNEARCSWDDFVHSTGQGHRCRDVLANNFGHDELAEVLAFLSHR